MLDIISKYSEKVLRTLCAAIIIVGSVGSILVAGAAASGHSQEEEGLIVAMGDSLTAGLGVNPRRSYPALLEKRLRQSGFNFRVVNSGVSGETSSGARSRVNWVLGMDPDIVILETGANDGLRGIDPELVSSNIAKVIEVLQARGVVVVLAGMQMVANMGEDYLETFNGLYLKLARRYDLIFMPFFLKDVAMQPHLNQPDGIHPNAEGYEIIAENILPYAREAIDKLRQRRTDGRTDS